jgi:hypothetical protein
MPDYSESEEIDAESSPNQEQEEVSFPWMIFALAVLFDLVGLVPILNIITEIAAGFIFGLWQKSYSPKTDPFLTFMIAKMVDLASVGFLPSNIGIVIYAYMRKKAANAVQSNVVKLPRQQETAKFKQAA